MYRKIINCFIAGAIIISIFAGCKSKDTTVSVNGETIDILKMEQYIDIEKNIGHMFMN